MADLLSTSDVMAYMDVDDDAQYDLIDALVDAAQSAIEREMGGRSLSVATSRTEYHTGMIVNGHGCIWTDHAPITAITSLYDDRRYSARLISSANYIQSLDDQSESWDMGKVQLWNDENAFASGQRNVQITYTGGWTTSTVPADILQAWKELVSFWYDNRERIGITQFQDGNYHVSWQGAHIPQELQSVFRGYAMVRWA